MDKAFEEFGRKIQALDESSFNTYAPLVAGICTGAASEAEVEYLLDCLLGMCNDDRLLGLFKRVCRAYFELYPEMVASEIYVYKEWYESGQAEENQC
mgnify:FL=1